MRGLAFKLRTSDSTKTGVLMGFTENLLHQKVGMAPLYDERRRFQRIHLQVPMFIRGRDAHEEQFLELARPWMSAV